MYGMLALLPKPLVKNLEDNFSESNSFYHSEDWPSWVPHLGLQFRNLQYEWTLGPFKACEGLWDALPNILEALAVGKETADFSIMQKALQPRPNLAPRVQIRYHPDETVSGHAARHALRRGTHFGVSYLGTCPWQAPPHKKRYLRNKSEINLPL
jgi:hypothetical protein